MSAKRRKVGDDNAAFPGRGISKRSNAPVNFKECAEITHQIEETANKLLMGEEDGDDSERNAPASSFIISQLLSRVRTLSEYIIQLQNDRPAATRVSIWQEDGTLAIPPYLDLDPSELEGHSEVHGAFGNGPKLVRLERRRQGAKPECDPFPPRNWGCRQDSQLRDHRTGV